MLHGLAWVYQLAQLKNNVTGEMEIEITGGATNVGVYKLTSGVVPAGRDVQTGPSKKRCRSRGGNRDGLVRVHCRAGGTDIEGEADVGLFKPASVEDTFTDDS